MPASPELRTESASARTARASAPSAPLILVFTDDPDQGGVAQYNHALLLDLMRRGYRAACAQPRSESPLAQGQRAAGVAHHWLPYQTGGKNFARTLTDMATPRAIFESTKPDFIIFSDCCPVSNLAARHAAIALRIPFLVVVGFVAEYLARDAAPCLGVIARHYAQAREVIAVSEDNLRLLRAHFGLPPSRGTVVHYGRPSVFFTPPDPAWRLRRRAELGIPPGAVVSLTAARLTPAKGYLHQLAAADRLGSLDRNHFIWIGEGDQRTLLERKIAERGWQGRFTLAGQQWNAADWYDIADFFVLPSEHEGMPLSVMEAMAKGLPVAASAVSGIPEELGSTGKLLPDPKADPAGMAVELSRIIARWTTDPEQRRQAGEACRQRAERLFHEERMLADTMRILEAALAAPSSAR